MLRAIVIAIAVQAMSTRDLKSEMRLGRRHEVADEHLREETDSANDAAAAFNEQGYNFDYMLNADAEDAASGRGKRSTVKYTDMVTAAAVEMRNTTHGDAAAHSEATRSGMFQIEMTTRLEYTPEEIIAMIKKKTLLMSYGDIDAAIRDQSVHGVGGQCFSLSLVPGKSFVTSGETRGSRIEVSKLIYFFDRTKLTPFVGAADMNTIYTHSPSSWNPPSVKEEWDSEKHNRVALLPNLVGGEGTLIVNSEGFHVYGITPDGIQRRMESKTRVTDSTDAFWQALSPTRARLFGKAPVSASTNSVSEVLVSGSLSDALVGFSPPLLTSTELKLRKGRLTEIQTQLSNLVGRSIPLILLGSANPVTPVDVAMDIENF